MQFSKKGNLAQPAEEKFRRDTTDAGSLSAPATVPAAVLQILSKSTGEHARGKVVNLLEAFQFC